VSPFQNWRVERYVAVRWVLFFKFCYMLLADFKTINREQAPRNRAGL